MGAVMGTQNKFEAAHESGWENLWGKLNEGGSVTFMCGFDIFVVMTFFESNMRKVRIPVGAVKLITSGVGFYISRKASDGDNTTVEALLQWLEALALIAYVFVDVWSHPDAGNVRAGVLQFEDESSCEAIEAVPTGGKHNFA